MINQQLLDFIKSQLLKGLDKETITKELLGSGWTEGNIQEGFSNIDSQLQVPQKVSFSPEDKLINTKEQPKIKKHIFRKILLVFIPIIILLEVINYVEYVYAKNKWDPEIQCDANMFMPCFGPSYQPIVVTGFYRLFPRLDPYYGVSYKPVIYLYPTKTEKVKVELDYKGKLIADYPSYDYSKKGWEITAYPDGTIINSDDREYSYIFWEGIPSKPADYDLSTGFVVRGEDTVIFLQDTLSKMGLTPKEYNEFIVYWYPKMKDNKYNLIHFADKQYTDTAPLTITPTPESILRVFMVFKPLDNIVSINPQEIKTFNRIGFSVIEWGGTELK